jgi:hypothetical protein
MKSCIKIIAGMLLLVGGMLFSGCVVTQLNAEVAPEAKLDDIKKIYVVRLEKDTRGVEKLIADRLNVMGKEATAGEKSAVPADAEAIVTYQDKWMWDITMYMIELNVQLRDAKTEMALATGHSLRTSLARKSPAEMVEEVLTEIYKKK